MYILLNKNNKVVDIRNDIPSYYSDNLILAEVKSIPEKYDYLTAENIKEETKTWTEIQEDYDENNKLITKEVEKSRTYFTCELVAKFRPQPTETQIVAKKKLQRKKLISQLVRKKYSQDDVEAILANYADDPDDLEYKTEFEAFQAYRKECKTIANETYGE